MRSSRLLLVVLFCLFPSSLLAQSTPAFNNDEGKSETATATKLGWFLEEDFRSYLLNSCSLQPLKTKKDTVVSSIPVPILNALGGLSPTSSLRKWVLLPKSYTAANAFLMISADKMLPALNADFMLPMDPLQDPETMLLAGGNYCGCGEC